MEVRAVLTAMAMGLAAVPAPAQDVNTVTQTEAGHRYGSDEAGVQLIEFLSYTCPACGSFAMQGDPALQIAYVRSGQVAIEYRPMVHNVLDLTVSMLVECGGADRFTANHTAFMLRQDKWLAEARKASEGQMQLWQQGGTSANARRAMASSLELYDIVEPNGLDRVAAGRCLADQTLADRLLAQAKGSREQFGVAGTPSFALNGQLLKGVHQWATLQPAIDDALAGAGTPD